MCSKDDLRCRHPNHPRTWYSKNIWCDMHRGPCPQCQAPCCAFSSYTTALENTQMSPMETENAQRLAKDIATWIPSGSDESTFMECTSCHRFVCPECCSVCPHPNCGDRMCCVSEPSDRALLVLTSIRNAIQIGNGFSATFTTEYLELHEDIHWVGYWGGYGSIGWKITQLILLGGKKGLLCDSKGS